MCMLDMYACTQGINQTRQGEGQAPGTQSPRARNREGQKLEHRREGFMVDLSTMRGAATPTWIRCSEIV